MDSILENLDLLDLVIELGAYNVVPSEAVKVELVSAKLRELVSLKDKNLDGLRLDSKN